MTRSGQLAGVVALVLLHSQPSRAEEVEWRDDWGRVGAAEYITVGAAVSGYVLVRFAVPKADSAGWRSGFLFDPAVRSAFRLGSREARERAERSADVLGYVLLANAVVVDPWVVGALARGSADVGWQLFVINAQSYSLSALLNGTVKLLIARERPYAEPCRDDPDYHEHCSEPDRYRAFYSSHSSFAATGAGLTCAHHTHLPLYGSQAADLAACVGSGLMALSVGALRVASDEHWATDVLVGQALGFATGYLLPVFVYYRGARSADAAPGDDAGAFQFWVMPSLTSVSVGGTF